MALRFASPSDPSSSRSMSAEPIRAGIAAKAILVLLIGAGLERLKAPVAPTSERRVGKCIVLIV
jgi:hypothetical protein